MIAAVIAAVTGLAAEARIAARFGIAVRAGGGGAKGAERAAEGLVAGGATALLSFGLAGGLHPALQAGDLLIPATVVLDRETWAADPGLMARLGPATPGALYGTLYGGGAVLATAADKAALHAHTGAVAVDLESAAVARVARRHGLPFAVLRAVCDPAGRDLPRAALVALDPDGRIGALRVGGAVLARPSDIPALIRLATDAARARRALVARVAAIGRL